MTAIKGQEWAVVGIVAMILFGLFAFLVLSQTQSDPVNKTQCALSEAHAAIGAYRHEYGIYPKSFQDLMKNGNKRNIAFISDTNDLIDSWGQQITFVTNQTGFEVRSSGEDKILGTEDDRIKEYQKIPNQ